jgi:hypothetical protein
MSTPVTQRNERFRPSLAARFDVINPGGVCLVHLPLLTLADWSVDQIMTTTAGTELDTIIGWLRQLFPAMDHDEVLRLNEHQWVMLGGLPDARRRLSAAHA